MATILERETASGQKRYRVQLRRKGVPSLNLTFDTKEAASDWIRDHEMQYLDNPEFYQHWAKRNKLYWRRRREQKERSDG